MPIAVSVAAVASLVTFYAWIDARLKVHSPFGDPSSKVIVTFLSRDAVTGAVATHAADALQRRGPLQVPRAAPGLPAGALPHQLPRGDYTSLSLSVGY